VAWKSKLWERVWREDAHLEHLRAGLWADAVKQPAAVRNADHARRAGLGDVVHADQPSQLDRCLDLLQALARRGGRRVLVVIHESTRQTPQAVARLDRAAAQHNAAFGLDHHRRRHLGVVPKDETVARARFDFTTFDDACHQGGAAVDAEMTQQSRGYD
jgi:hypothetical protein